MKRKTQIIQSLLLGALLAAGFTTALTAQQTSVQPGEVTQEGRYWIRTLNFSVSTQPGRTLHLRSDLGSVLVKTGGKDGVVEGRLIAKVYSRNKQRAMEQFRGITLQAIVVSDGVRVEGEIEDTDDHDYDRLSIVYEVTVPSRYSLDIETMAGAIEMNDVDGTVKAVTAGGHIETQNITGLAIIETAGGHIRLGNIGARLRARTAGGHIQVGDVKADAELETAGGHIIGRNIDGEVRAQTAGGSIIFQTVSGPVRAETAGGQISIGKSGGAVRAQTAGGSVRVFGARGAVRVETAGGSIDLLDLDGAVHAVTSAGRILAYIRSDQKTFSASHLETSVGDVKVYLPVNLAVTIEAEIDNAHGHRIKSDFPLMIQGSDQEYVDTIRGSGPINGGGEVLKIRTTMGNIQIIKITERILQKFEREKERMQEKLVRQLEREEERHQRRLKRKQIRIMKHKEKNKDNHDDDDDDDPHDDDDDDDPDFE
jgi:hypothetical protein